jgi:tetratricopeptide (TPR) repeat protein
VPGKLIKTAPTENNCYMNFDPQNKVVQLCARGIEQEGKGQPAEAARLYNEAWAIADNDIEKFTAAHYVARQQANTSDKLTWDKIALQHALNIDDDSVKPVLPSLYLNIGKCYEDLHDQEKAKENYQAALSFADFLPNDSYGNMIKAGIAKALREI